MAEVTFFATPAHFRRWLERNHAKADELWVGFHKKSTGKPSITWPESVDEALCFGWIDGLRRTVDAGSYCIRFTPRRSGSTWSAVNIRRATALIKDGRMMPAGLAAFEQRDEARAVRYSYERAAATLSPDFERRLRANKKAWTYFQAQPPGYRKTAAWWIVSATKEETRLRRLQTLIDHSAAGRPVPPLTRPGSSQ
jgi:uncharacterized protein YdeI (YjbR/CyaY-like superfamily)